jgi:hypothetical protein
MFRTRDESINLAYARQEARMAYVDRGDGKPRGMMSHDGALELRKKSAGEPTGPS